jgi:RNA polymerase sigma-70 factor (ECF subfamily)
MTAESASDALPKPADRGSPGQPDELGQSGGKKTGRQPGQEQAVSAAEVVSPEDRRLLQACLASAPGCWDVFVGRFAGLFIHLVDRTCGQRQQQLAAADRDDLVAEILVEIIRNDAAVLRAFAGRSSLPSYLTVIARRVAVRSICRGPGNIDSVSMRTDPPDHHDEERLAADREEIETLLGRLDDAEARLVRLHHLEARSYGEISRLTGLPIGSIGPALSKARQKMRAGSLPAT